MAGPDEKARSFNDLLKQGVVMVQLDARRPGVRVPDHLKNEMQLRLNFNHIRGKGDLVVNGWGIRETLSFNRVWTPVSVPWSAVYMMLVNQEDPVVYAEDLPEEMVEAALARLQREGYSLEELEERRPRPLWSAKPEAAPAAAPAVAPAPVASPAPAVAEQAPVAAPPTPELQTSAPRRGHLRLVK